MNAQEYYYYPEAGPSYSQPSHLTSSPSHQQYQQQSSSLNDWDYYGSNPNVSPSGSSIDTPVSDAPATLSYPLIAGGPAVAPEYPASAYAEQQSWHTPPLASVAQSKSSLSDALGSFSYEHAPQSHVGTQGASYYSGQHQYATYATQPQQDRTMAVSYTVRNNALSAPTNVPSHHLYVHTHPVHHGHGIQHKTHHSSPVQQQQQPAYLPANSSQAHSYSSAHTQQPYTASAYSHAHVPLALPQGHAAQEYRTTHQPTTVQAPLYHPKPQHPLPEWTKQPELVSGPGVKPGHVASAPAPAQVDVGGGQQPWLHHAAYPAAVPFQFGQGTSINQEQAEEGVEDGEEDDEMYDDEDENEAPEIRQERTVPVQIGSLSGSSLLFQPISAAVQSRFAPKSSAAAPTAAPNASAPTSQQYPMLPLGMSAPAYWA